jgi:hypothetical protein
LDCSLLTNHLRNFWQGDLLPQAAIAGGRRLPAARRTGDRALLASGPWIGLDWMETAASFVKRSVSVFHTFTPPRFSSWSGIQSGFRRCTGRGGTVGLRQATVAMPSVTPLSVLAINPLRLICAWRRRIARHADPRLLLHISVSFG